MAELFEDGVVNTVDAAAESNITVDMLDYTYVNGCEDHKQLSAILNLLKSGKEGYYPDLIKVTEQRLLERMPKKELSKYKALSHKVTPAEVSEALSDVSSWQSDVNRKDASLGGQESSSSKRSMPPVRGSTNGSIPNDNTDDPQSSAALSDYVTSVLGKNQIGKIVTQRNILKVWTLNDQQRKRKSELERIKGNESFRVEENEEAVNCYTRSIAYCDNNALVFANRAMAYIRLELYDLAEDDSSVALKLDPTYVKAYSRRGTVRFKRGRYADAAADFEQALTLEPNSTELAKLLEKAKAKYSEVEGGKKIGESIPVVDDYNGGVIGYEVTDSFESLLLPSGDAVEVVSNTVATRVQAEYKFVKITIDSDSDSDSDEEDEKKEDEGDQKSSSEAPANGFKRIPIVDDDDESDSDVEDIIINKKTEDQKPATTDDTMKGEGEVATEKAEENDSADRYSKESARQEIEKQLELFKENGNDLMKKGKFTKAIEYYNKCLDIDPQYIPALNNRAQAHLSLKKYSEVIGDCTTVIDSVDPRNLKALYRRATAYYYTKQLDKSEIDAKTILDYHPTSEQATDLLSKIEKLTLHAKPTPPTPSPFPPPPPPTATTATTTNGADGSTGGKVQQDAATEQKKSALEGADRQNVRDVVDNVKTVSESEDKEKESNSLKEKGNGAMGKKDYVSAVLFYTSAIKLDPNNFAAYSNRALGYLKMLQFTDAIADATVVIERDNINADVAASAGRKHKCMFRRACACHSLAKAGQDVTSNVQSAVKDLDAILAADAANKLAQVEKKQIVSSFFAALAGESAKEVKKAKPAAAAKATSAPVTSKSPPADSGVDGLSMKSVSSRKIGKDRDDSNTPPPAPTPTSPSPATSIAFSTPRPPSAPASFAEKKKNSGTSSPTKSVAHTGVPFITPKMAVPTDPPKTAYELERVWRGLKSDTSRFAEYIALFKKSTYKKVIKETTSHDLLSSLFEVLRSHSPSVKCTLTALEGISEISSFNMTLSLLPEVDLKAVSEIFDGLKIKEEQLKGSTAEKDVKRCAKIEELKTLYNIS